MESVFGLPLRTTGAATQALRTDAGKRLVTANADLLLGLLVESQVQTALLAQAFGFADSVEELRAQYRDAIGGSYGQ